MSDMVEIDIDFDYCGEVEMILAHDECGEHEDVEFYRNDLLASENAKLRELVRHMLTCATNVDFDGSPACQVCPYDRDGDRSACDFGRRAQELGIEME